MNYACWWWSLSLTRYLLSCPYSCFVKYLLVIKEMFVSLWNVMLHTGVTLLDWHAGIKLAHQASAWDSTLSDHRNLITIQFIYQLSLKYWVLVIKVAQGNTQRLQNYVVIQKLESKNLFFQPFMAFFSALYGVHQEF